MANENSVSEDSVVSDKIVSSGSVSSQPSNDRRKLFRRLVTLAGLGLVGAVLSQDKTGLLPTVKGATITIDTTNTGAATTELDSTIGTGAAFFGFATAGTGSTYGVFGDSASTSGKGVVGLATAGTGSTYGVYGESASTSGTGVFGFATAGTGSTYGVEGVSASTSGTGVFGGAAAGTGITYGVEGVSASTSGTGVFGLATAGTGSTTGVFGQSASTSGVGVLGSVINASGIPLVAQGASGQTADLQEWQNNSSTVLSAVHADGSLTLGSSGLAIVTPIAAFGQQGAWERDTSDGNGFQFSWVKTRGGAACQANDSIGDLAFDFMNTTPTLVQGAVQRGIVNNATAGSESTGFQFYCMNSGSMGLRVQITSNGNVLASGFVNTSDMRFKEDIQPIENALDKITHLNGVYFKWNQEYRERLKRSDSQERQVGLVAQQVRDVIPEIVANMRDSEAGDYLAVDYNRLVPVLIQAIKELKEKEIEAMKNENEKLNERIAVLERIVKQFAAS